MTNTSKGQETAEQAAKLAELEANKADAQPVRRHDETVPGGRYRTADGRWVNGEGEELEGEK